MKLEQICEDIADVVQGLMFNDDISVSYKADILDDILSIIGDDVAEGIEPDPNKVERMTAKLEDFQEAYEVDLSGPIQNLKSYLLKEVREYAAQYGYIITDEQNITR